MTRIPKIHIEGALYYVTTRGDNNEDVFKALEDYKTYLGLLTKYKEQYGFKLFSFVLAPNHLHLLFELKVGISISDIMHDLNANYTKYFNSKYERKGHLFQERSKMVLAEKDIYLLPLIAYTHLNPSSLDIVSNINDYPYSSHILYSAINAPDSIFEGLDLVEEMNEVLKKLPVNHSSYADFMKNISKKEMEILGNDLKKKVILGSEEFIKKVETTAQNLQLTESQTPITDNRIFIGSALVIILGVFTFYFYSRAMALKQDLGRELARKKEIIDLALFEERKKITRDVEEKHQADLVSFQAMAKRLELEKEKAKAFERKLNNNNKPEEGGI